MHEHYHTVDPNAVDAALSVLARGGIILYPTDTIYGLGVDARNPDALTKLYTLKGRQDNKPVSVLVPDMETANALGIFNEAAQVLATHFFPGPLTLVVPLRPGATLRTCHNQHTVGIRVINHPFCQTLSVTAGFPLPATSANRSGQPTGATIPEILNQFGAAANDIDLIIDAGNLPGGTPSTVIDTTTSPPTLIRAGAISWNQIESKLARSDVPQSPPTFLC